MAKRAVRVCHESAKRARRVEGGWRERSKPGGWSERRMRTAWFVRPVEGKSCEGWREAGSARWKNEN